MIYTSQTTAPVGSTGYEETGDAIAAEYAAICRAQGRPATVARKMAEWSWRVVDIEQVLALQRHANRHDYRPIVVLDIANRKLVEWFTGGLNALCGYDNGEATYWTLVAERARTLSLGYGVEVGFDAEEYEPTPSTRGREIARAFRQVKQHVRFVTAGDIPESLLCRAILSGLQRVRGCPSLAIASQSTQAGNFGEYERRVRYWEWVRGTFVPWLWPSHPTFDGEAGAERLAARAPLFLNPEDSAPQLGDLGYAINVPDRPGWDRIKPYVRAACPQVAEASDR